MWSFKISSPVALTMTLLMPAPFPWLSFYSQLLFLLTAFWVQPLNLLVFTLVILSSNPAMLVNPQGPSQGQIWPPRKASEGGQNGAEKQFKYQVQKQPPINRPYLDPARDKVVRGGEYELLGTGCLWRRQDHLPSSRSIWASQDELLFGRSRGVHCGDYLDLLSCLLICYNL